LFGEFSSRNIFGTNTAIEITLFFSRKRKKRRGTKKKGGGLWPWDWGKKKQQSQQIMREFNKGREQAKYREHMKKNPLKQVKTIDDAFHENLPKTKVHIVDDEEIKRLEENLGNKMVGNRLTNLTTQSQEFPTIAGGKRKRNKRRTKRKRNKRRTKRKRKGGGKKKTKKKIYQPQTKPYKFEIIKKKDDNYVQVYDWDKNKKRWIKEGEPIKLGKVKKENKKKSTKKKTPK